MFHRYSLKSKQVFFQFLSRLKEILNNVLLFLSLTVKPQEKKKIGTERMEKIALNFFFVARKLASKNKKDTLTDFFDVS